MAGNLDPRIICIEPLFSGDDEVLEGHASEFVLGVDALELGAILRLLLEGFILDAQITKLPFALALVEFDLHQHALCVTPRHGGAARLCKLWESSR